MQPLNRVSRILSRTLPVLVGLVAIASATAQPQYHLIDLGTLGGSVSQAYGINEHGVVAGYAVETFPPGGSPAALWDRNGSIVSLGVPPGDFVHARGLAVNDVSQMAAYGTLSTEAYVAFLWENGTWTELLPLPGQPRSLPEDINNAGQVVGRSYTSGGASRATLWVQGVVTDLGTLGANGDSTARGINDVGRIVGDSFIPDVGTRPFIWQDGVMTDLGVLPGDDYGAAYAINDRGDAVGESLHDVDVFYQAAQATLWRADGEIVDLGLTPAFLPGPCQVDLPFWVTNKAYDVNNCGQVVGGAKCITSGSSRAAFLWQDGVNYNLNDLVVSGDSIEMTKAVGINDAGQIVGIGNANGELHGFLLQPLTPQTCMPGDLDTDHNVGLQDFLIFETCLAGPDVTTPPAGCDPVDFGRADLDLDQDVDLMDAADFQVVFTGPDTTPPAAPARLATTLGIGSVNVTWSHVADLDLDGYRVYRSTTSGGPYQQLNQALVAASRITDSDVVFDTTYYYVVAAVDTSGHEGPISAETVATPRASVFTHVESIVPDVGRLNGERSAIATVTVLDNVGDPVSGATVTGTFFGDLDGESSGVTDATGVAVLSIGPVPGGQITLAFCVDDVVHTTLAYDAVSNVEFCVSY